MEHPAAAIARELARQAERLCRHYLSNGRRVGNYWLVGDARNAPGRSLYVRLREGPEGGGAGKWTDAQSGEHGDLLDIIRAAVRSGTLSDALCEARRFLSVDLEPPRKEHGAKRRSGSAEAARRLLAITAPIDGTPAQAYLERRCIPSSVARSVLRFHPRCWYRRSPDDIGELPPAMPAIIAPVTDRSGIITGAHRTWLMADGSAKARVATPRRAMGRLLGNGVRFGPTDTVMAAGEGLESCLSLLTVLPRLSAIAALSAAHLAALEFPDGLERLYVTRDRDFAGAKAFDTLARRGNAAGIEVLPLYSGLEDLNADLVAFGPELLAAGLDAQLRSGDWGRFG